MGTADTGGRRARLLATVRAVREGDEALLDAVRRLSARRRIFAPLAFTVGALALLIDGLKLLFTNWRLLLIQIPPAAWTWLAMLDLRAHLLHGRSFHELRGLVLVPIGLAIVALTIGAFFLNAVFAFAILDAPASRIRPAVARARARLVPVSISGGGLGAMLAVATTVSPRWGSPWFAVTLGVVVALMMISYVAVPARLIGVRRQAPRRDKVTASLLGSALGFTVCTPPYILGRVGILMLGSSVLALPGIVFLAVGLALQAGATGAVRAIKLGSALAGGPVTR